MGLVYLPTWMVDFCGKLVGKYTLRPMDAMGYASEWLIASLSMIFADKQKSSTKKHTLPKTNSQRPWK